MGNFCHLHLHTEYSLLDGACRIKDIPKIAKEMGHSAVAITDHGAMYGVIEFYKACLEEGIKPIIGCEVYVAPNSRFEKNEGRGTSPYHLVLLCKNEKGYKNLMHLVSRGWTEGFYSKPRVDMELLRQYSDGLIALSACLAGYIPRAIMAGNFSGAKEYAVTMRDIFGKDNFYLELQDHGIDDQKTVNESLIRLARECGIGLVATNDVHYLRRADADTQAILLCIQTNNVITDGRPIGFETDEFYYKSTSEMERIFGGINDGEAIKNTVRIADMCNLKIDFDSVYMPKFPFTNGVDPTEFLRGKTETGLCKKLSRGHIVFNEEYTEELYRERIDYELSVISKMGFSEYYLVVADFIAYAKNNGIPVGPGRGSGAGSLVAYLMEITDIDPMRYGLLFERFLNPERVSLPDFDVDFCYERRDEVIEYVKEKYGTDHVAQIITFGTMAARAAVRDVGRALGMSYSDTDVIARLIPRTPGATLKEAMKGKELRELYESLNDVRKLIDTATALEGMPRHASTHAAGVVITSEPLSDIVPLAVNGGTVVTQFDMDTVAKVGLVKFDFLALRYITIISNTVKRINGREPDFDIAKIPKDDKATFDLISCGETNGVFQLESAGMRRMLVQLKPNCMADIIAAIALFRPGPMDSIPDYIERKHNGGGAKYSSPELESILKETYGCIVYQEQVMQIFRAVAGYSFGRADVVRRAMAKKKADVLMAERDGFVSGAVLHGMSESDASALFDDMESFSSYAFNKSHAAAYALISYQTAYLKRHYTKDYMASLLDSVLGWEGKTAEYIIECGDYGIKVLPPDINESLADYTVGEDGIRYGLAALKGLGRQFISSIANERSENGKFRSFYDFALRMSEYDLNKRQVESLIKSGAFDGLGTKRSQLIASFENIIESLHEKKRSGVAGQIDMFGNGDGDENGGAKAPEFVYPDIPEFPRKKLLELEKQVSGMYFSGHILDDYKNELSAVDHVPIAFLVRDNAEENGEDSENIESDESENPAQNCSDHDRVTVVGLVSKRTVKETRKSERMMFVTLEDKTGDIEIVVFPKQMQKYSQLYYSDEVLVIKGELSIEEERKPKILSNYCCFLTEYKETARNEKNDPSASDLRTSNGNATADMEKKPLRLYLRIESISSPVYRKISGLIEIFCGETTVFIYENSSRQYKRFENCGADVTCERLILELKKLVGEENVVVK